MSDTKQAPTSIRLASGVRLRREHFGGLAFDPRTGNTIELDRGAFRLLELAATGVHLEKAWEVIVEEGLERPRGSRDIVRVAHSLLELRLVVDADAVEGPVEQPGGKRWPAGPPLTGPEVVHWAITYGCHDACPDCYAARHRKIGAVETRTAEALHLVDRVAEWGAFQLAIGGGEPLLRDDLPVVTRHARKRGLAVHVTTSGKAPAGVSDTLLESLTCLQIGIRHDDLLSKDAARAGQSSLLSGLCRRAKASGVGIGANLILCRTVVDRFEEALERLVEIGFGRITLLRYKPPGSVDRWLAEAPEPAELRGMEARIARQLDRNPDMVVRLDCALAFVERHLSQDRARRAGLRGCVAGTRIIALGPDGSVYPCSQLVAPRFWAGNVLDTSPATIWHGSKVLRRVRNRRAQRSFRQTLCGACCAIEQCGGCMAMSQDGLGADPGCPEPRLPPQSSLGRDGRVADLQRYLDRHRTISIGEYMERYSVGQRRAVSELRRFPGLVLALPEKDGKRKGPDRRKADRYELVTEDVVGEIQETIGYTSWGFPYATCEEIAGWIGQPAQEANYPAWLSETGASPVTENDELTWPRGDPKHAPARQRRRR